jgi:hypothetical protein
MSTSISRPGVEIAQEFVTSSPTISSPSLVPVIIGPCIRVISAFNDDGEPESDAYAGTYQDGYGTVAYDLPSIGEEDSLSSLTDNIRVFLLLGSNSTELNSEDDEETIVAATNDAGEGYDVSEGTFTDSNATFQQLGVEAGDVVRVTWRGEEVDLLVEDDATADDSLTLTAGVIDEDVFEGDYEVIRNPAEFVYDSGAQADYDWGTDANYLQIAARETDDDGDAADYAGSAGDLLTVVIAETEEISSGTSTGYCGGAIFTDGGGGTFETDIAATAGVPTVDHYIVIGTPASSSLQQVLHIYSESILLIEETTAGLAAQNWVVGSVAATGSDGATGGADETLFSSATGAFDTTIPSGAVPAAPTTTTYIEIEGVGVFTVTTVTDDNNLVISAGAGTSLSGKSFTIITQTHTGTGDGVTSAVTDFIDPSATFSTDGVVATTHTMDIDDTLTLVSTVTSETRLVLASGQSSGDTITYEVVESTTDLVISWDGDNEEVTLTLGRTAGVSTNTYVEIEDALTDDTDDSYNATVAAFLTAAVEGSGTITQDEVGSYSLDGGADDNQLILDADLIGSETPIGKIYVSYRALRVGMSAGADDPSLLEYESTSDAADALGDATTDNPLSLGVYFALLNAPSQAVSAIGISEITASKPDGTLDAYAEALEFLEGQEVYAMAPMTQDPTVHQIFQTHVDSMSESENTGERILFFSQAFPAYATATTLASGTTGNTGTVVGEAEGSFTTSVDLTAAGVQSAINVGDDVYLVVSALSSSDDSPDGVNGTQALYGVAITEVDTGDDFSLTINFEDRTEDPDGMDWTWSADWDDQVDVTWTVYAAGDAISAKSDQRDAVAEIGEGFEDRRCFHVWPPQVTGDVDGSSAVLEGFYLAAAIAGMVAEKTPSQGFTNLTVSGFTGLKYSNNYFSDSQLARIAGGGQMIWVQESQNAALKCRHQLATDVSTVQRRELSITKTIDYVAKFFRSSLTSQIGKFNITQSFMDSLSVRVQGLGRFLVATNILNDFKVNTIEVNGDDPSQVDIVCTLDVQYPCNTIYMTLQV